MPSHIDAWVGQWKEGMECNIAAVEADDKYVELTGNESQFYKFYRMHNHHFVVWCAMFEGQYEIALKYARKAAAANPAGDENSGVQFMLAGIIPMGAIFLESYVGLPYHVMIRFGMWDDIIAEPTVSDKESLRVHHSNTTLRSWCCLCLEGHGCRGRGRTGTLL
jgi:hypothetical protein